MNPITRRDALSGVAASLLIVKPETAFGSQANSAVSFGIIGTGGRGRYVGKIFTDDPRARLAAICDIRPERIDLAKTEIPAADKVPVHKDLKELLARTDIDAVLIATPVFLHPEHFEAAANAKKHIYCEKPAGAEVAGVKRLIRAAERADKSKVIQFGFQQRFSPEYLTAEKLLRGGDVGELTLMISYWVYGNSAYDRPDIPVPTGLLDKIKSWGRWKDTSGDFIVEQDCHGLDVLNWFAQAHPLKAIGEGGKWKPKKDPLENSDHACIIYTYPGRLKGWMLGSQLPPRPYWDVKEQFFGTKGMLETERQYYKHMDAASGKWKEVHSKREITIDAVEHFLACILEKKPFSMAMDAANSTLTSILGVMAVDMRREVTWDEMMKSA